MNSLFFRIESAACIKKAENLGIPYTGKDRLNVVHFGYEQQEFRRVKNLVTQLTKESDYFRAWVVPSWIQTGEMNTAIILLALFPVAFGVSVLGFLYWLQSRVQELEDVDPPW